MTKLSAKVAGRGFTAEAFMYGLVLGKFTNLVGKLRKTIASRATYIYKSTCSLDGIQSVSVFENL